MVLLRGIGWASGMAEKLLSSQGWQFVLAPGWELRVRLLVEGLGFSSCQPLYEPFEGFLTV